MIRLAGHWSVALPGLLLLNARAAAERFWRAAWGEKGETPIKTILINNLRGEILQVVFCVQPAVDYAPALHAEVIDRIVEVQFVRMKRGYYLVFSSEPDVSLRDVNNRPLLAIEIKAGADPAGALERLGAAMKSFENDKNLNPQVKTVYVVRWMTPELEKRIRQSSPFDYTFGLSELLLAGKSQTTFTNLALRTTLGK